MLVLVQVEVNIGISIHNFSSILKSSLINVTWADDTEIDSTALEQLKGLSQLGFLSVRIIVFFMVRDPSPLLAKKFGTIGPAFSIWQWRRLHYEEVHQPPPSFFFPNVPQCQGQNVSAWLYNVPFRRIEIVDEALGNPVKISADFGNAIVMYKYQNLMFDIVNEASSNTSCFVSLGEIDYLQNNWLLNAARVQEFPNFPSGSGWTNFLNDVELELIEATDMLSFWSLTVAVTFSQLWICKQQLRLVYGWILN